MKLQEIAERINAHLQRFEAHPKLNPWDDGRVGGTHPFYMAGAYAHGSRVFVKYISYQCHSSLVKAEALAYLEWLDAGNVGKHWIMLREQMRGVR